MTARIRLCGRLEVELGGERIEHRLPGRQGPLVLALLAVTRERPVTRDELIGALWPDRPPADPDEALSALLSKVRQALGRDVLTGRRELALALPADAEIDVEQAHAAAERSRDALAAGDPTAAWEAASAAVAIVGRGFLPGHDAPWVHERRVELANLHLRTLEVQAQAGLALGGAHADGAERAAAELVREAPLREAGHRLLMEALAARGEVAEALAAYERLRVVLRDELGTTPGEAARAVHERLLTGEAAAPAAPAERLPEKLAQSLASPWVGRHATLRRLKEAARHAAAGETELALVAGEGGIGKTRLVAELAERMPRFEVLYGRCDEEELFAFGPWIDMLRPRLARLPDAELEELLRGAPELSRLLPEIHDRLPGLAALPAAGNAETQRRQLFAAVVAVVRGLAARAPVLMIVDDLHWADRSSLVLARHLAREPRLGPVLLVGTYRDTEMRPGHPLGELLAELARGREPARLRLEGMDEREVAELIGEEAGDGAVAAIHAETGGNPFFAKQLARNLEESGEAREVPDGVRDVIMARVGRLPGEAGRVLGIAALIGRDFDLELLEPVAGLSEDALLDLLDAAVRGALLVEVASTPGRYSFAHALWRTTLEAELSATRRARLHLRIGEAIEALHGARPERWLAELARHFGAAGPRAADRAVAYAERAAAQAVEQLAYDEAARLLDAAAALRRARRARGPGGARAAGERTGGRGGRCRPLGGGPCELRPRRGRRSRRRRRGRVLHAALGHAGGTWEQYAVTDAENIALLEEALRRLPAQDGQMRARVLARIAVHRSFARGARGRRARDRGRGGRDGAPDRARLARGPDAGGDADGRAARPLAARPRRRAAPARGRADRADRAARRDHLRRRRAHLARRRTARAVPAGGGRCAPRAPRRARRGLAAARAAAPPRRHARDARRARGGLRARRADRARDVRAGGARGGGGAAALADPRPVARGQHGRSPQRARRARPAGAVFERLARTVAAPGWLPALAWAHAQDGRPEAARELIEAMGDDGFASIPRDSNFISRLAQVAHVIAELGDAGLAAGVERLLAPYAEFWVVLGPAASTLGPVAYSVGALRLLMDRPEAAAAAFELALERSETMRARPYVARSQAGLAAALRVLGERDRADEIASRAAATARELGMLRLDRELDGVLLP